MNVTVIVPSRLQVNPASESGNLYLDRALKSVTRQEGRERITQIIVCVDPGKAAAVPPRFTETSLDFVTVQVREAPEPGQAAALNVGVREARNDVLAFLEDDDYWEPRRLRYGLAVLEQGHDMVTSNQRVIDQDGNHIGIDDFPTPSGWLLRRALLRAPAFDQSYRYHLDTEFLGWANSVGLKRAHIVEQNAPWRDWLVNVRRHSAVVQAEEVLPLVVRTDNPRGGMARIRTDPGAMAVSQDEHRRMHESYGGVPW